MSRIIVLSICCFFLIPPAAFGSIDLLNIEEATLYCEGSIKMTDPNSTNNKETELQTDGIVIIKKTFFYIHINGLLVGKTLISDIKIYDTFAVGHINASSDYNDRPPLKADFNLNRFTGDLIMLDKAKPIFYGKCKTAKPLF